MSSRSYTYRILPGKSVSGLISAIEVLLSYDENMETQQITGDNSAYRVVQARVRGGKAKQFTGMDKAVTVRFISESSNQVNMEIGETKWVDKGAVMTFSMFLLWPLAVTSGVGIYKQQKLLSRIKATAGIYIRIRKQRRKKHLKRFPKWKSMQVWKDAGHVELSEVLHPLVSCITVSWPALSDRPAPAASPEEKGR